MSMQYIRQRYAVPAKRGARIRYTGMGENKVGSIVSAVRGAHLKVRFDDGTFGYFHPTWEIEYLDAAK
ncbi:hypothetical protein [Paeniglutamicibacter terrestris]|uniref:DUF1918 domain-containing protein n=1 Tax=Paeniglutamicibacter terrestris TaxID=2723403 RepID=A0ABX1G875_9MICC|nr:hypothetical protein [Paeniglutamicibacter terrestris]NKG22224.1 hypothetical protein [Paeniglutamicibacter terrestris]